MGHLADAFRHSMKTLDEIHERTIRWEKEYTEKCKSEQLAELKSLGLREHEAEAWIKGEASFPKPIAKPIGRRGKSNLMYAIIFLVLALNALHNTVQANSPTESLQHNIPTVKATLPRRLPSG